MFQLGNWVSSPWYVIFVGIFFAIVRDLWSQSLIIDNSIMVLHEVVKDYPIKVNKVHWASKRGTPLSSHTGQSLSQRNISHVRLFLLDQSNYTLSKWQHDHNNIQSGTELLFQHTFLVESVWNVQWWWLPAYFVSVTETTTNLAHLLQTCRDDACAVPSFFSFANVHAVMMIAINCMYDLSIPYLQLRWQDSFYYCYCCFLYYWSWWLPS